MHVDPIYPATATIKPSSKTKLPKKKFENNFKSLKNFFGTRDTDFVGASSRSFFPFGALMNFSSERKVIKEKKRFTFH